MSFKAQIAADIRAVFLNAAEFGAVAEIAGHAAVPIVEEKLELEQPPSSADERPGVSYEGVTVYADAADVPDELVSGKATTFRGEEWFVLSQACDFGLKIIQLYRERA